MNKEENLPRIVKEMEEIILASSGSDPFEEILKIISIKLFSENKYKTLDKPYELFTAVKREWPGMFSDSSVLELDDKTLNQIFILLKDIKLKASKLEIIDSAFEYLLPRKAKGNRGQYFTPRHVIDIVIEILDPKRGEKILDPACGSGGFLLHSANYMKTDEGIFGIDFDKQMQRVAEIVMLMTGLINIKIINADALGSMGDLHYKENFFDVIMTNPPFGGEIKDRELLQNYELANNKNGMTKNIVEKHILFIERVIKLLKPGGRACIIVPQGVLNNTSLNYVRDWIYEKCRVVGVIGLDTNTFKPFTNVKTSLLFIQKWKGIPLKDYELFMDVSENSGKNRAGKLLFKNYNSNKIIDTDLYDIKNNFIDFIEKRDLGF